MMNEDVYLCLTKPPISTNYYVEFVDDLHRAAIELKRGARVFKLNALTELKSIDVTYTETTYE